MGVTRNVRDVTRNIWAYQPSLAEHTAYHATPVEKYGRFCITASYGRTEDVAYKITRNPSETRLRKYVKPKWVELLGGFFMELRRTQNG